MDQCQGQTARSRRSRAARVRAPQLVTRYRLHNTTGEPLEATLRLAHSPVPGQSAGAVPQFAGRRQRDHEHASGRRTRSTSTIRRCGCRRRPTHSCRLGVDAAASCPGARRPRRAAAQVLHDDFGHASGALVYKFELPAQGEREVAVVAPLTEDGRGRGTRRHERRRLGRAGAQRRRRRVARPARTRATDGAARRRSASSTRCARRRRTSCCRATARRCGPARARTRARGSATAR